MALAAYLNRVRGTAADPADVVICSGFAQGLALTARAMRARGARRGRGRGPVGPGVPRDVAAAGLESVAVPVDERGLRGRRPRASSTRTAWSSRPPTSTRPAPSSRPTAGPRSSTGRARRDALDRRGRLRRRVPLRPRADRRDPGPVPRPRGLRGLGEQDPGPRPAPGLAAPPPALTDEPIAGQAGRRHGLAALDQLAFADVLERGELDHHLRRMRPIYRAAATRCCAALARHLPDLRPGGAAAGLHVLAWLPDDVDEAASSRRGARPASRGALRRGGSRRARRPDLRLRRHRPDGDRARDRAAGGIDRRDRGGRTETRPASVASCAAHRRRCGCRDASSGASRARAVAGRWPARSARSSIGGTSGCP